MPSTSLTAANAPSAPLSARVRVPATIANLGPGFDALGLTLDLWLTAEASLAERDSFGYSGFGLAAGSQITDSGDSMLHQGARAVFARLGLAAPALAIHADNPIPLARGLGSSSAALVAGAALADALSGGQLGRLGVLEVCAKLEGHPDNVAPAVLGGFTTSAMHDDGSVTSVALPLPSDWRVLVAVPRSELATHKARAALPSHYSRQDAVFNLSRSALWVAGIAAGRPEVLREACRDVIHQPYRAPLIPGLLAGIEAALAAGALAAFLSGAGPSLAAIAVADQLEAVRAALLTFSPDVLVLAGAGGYELLP
jgi:homoserine kinase